MKNFLIKLSQSKSKKTIEGDKLKSPSIHTNDSTDSSCSGETYNVEVPPQPATSKILD
jgi:hypothetical protein